MKTFQRLALASACLLAFACAEDDPVPAEKKRIEIATAASGDLTVALYAAENLYAGYNPVRLLIRDDGKPVNGADVTLHPLMTMTSMTHGCPVEKPVSAGDGAYDGAVLFTMPSGDMGTWALGIRVTRNNVTTEFALDIDVEARTPSRVMSFTDTDKRRYYLGYHFPAPMKIGVNTVNFVAYTQDGADYPPLTDLTMALTPEMPSMDHGSPNNEDPVHREDGHYEGKVNFTMTGDWRLHLDIHRDGEDLGSRYFDVIVN